MGVVGAARDFGGDHGTAQLHDEVQEVSWGGAALTVAGASAVQRKAADNLAEVLTSMKAVKAVQPKKAAE